MKHVVCMVVGLSSIFLLIDPGWVQAQNEKPLSQGVAVHRDLEYAVADGISLKLDLYVPEATGKPLPVVMWVHGGGWQAGNKANPPILSMVKSGFAVASIDYRLSQVAIFPAQIYDCKAAVRWLRAHAGEYGLNPGKIGAAGSSAGGHLVALLGTTAHHPELEGTEGNPGVSSQVQAVCDFYGPADFLHWKADGQQVPMPENPDDPIAQLLGGIVSANPEKARAASPVYYVTPQACPFFIAHGDRDGLVPLQQSIALNQALLKAGVPTSLYVVKGAGHSFNDPVAAQKAVDFFVHYLQTP
jgi:acetyl esterase/lipase